MIDLYTTCTWAVKWREVAKLVVQIRDQEWVKATFPAASHVQDHLQPITSLRRARGRWQLRSGSARESNPPCRPFQEAPSVLKGPPGPASSHETASSSTESASTVAPPDAVSHAFLAQSYHSAERLLHVLESAIRAYDVHRGLQVIEELREVLGMRHGLAAVKREG